MNVRVGHSPDPDDAFMYWALTTDLVDTRGFRFEQVLADIQTLNQWARAARLEVTAISLAAYPFVQDDYALLPHGASVGSGYGPVLVAREPLDPGDLGGREVVDVDRLACDEDRPVARADRGAVGKEGVVVLDERVRGERDRGHLEPGRASPVVQCLDVRQHLLEAEAAGIDEIGREPPVHEGVIGVGAVADTDVHEAATLPALPGR